MSSVMLAAVLPVSKYIWLRFFFYFLIFLSFYILIVCSGRTPVNIGWRACSSTHTTVWGTLQ